jgi:hypothetical protein
MPAPKTSVAKIARTTQPQFLGTSHVQHTGSIIMTVAVERKLRPREGLGLRVETHTLSYLGEPSSCSLLSRVLYE